MSCVLHKDLNASCYQAGSEKKNQMVPRPHMFSEKRRIESNAEHKCRRWHLKSNVAMGAVLDLCTLTTSWDHIVHLALLLSSPSVLV